MSDKVKRWEAPHGLSHVKLDTLSRVRDAQGKLFRLCAQGEITPADMSRMMFGLASIRDTIARQFELEDYREQFARLEQIEQRLSEPGKRTLHS